MTRLTTYIQQHLSLRLGLLILLVVGGVFCVSLSYLFYESKRQTISPNTANVSPPIPSGKVIASPP